MSAGLSHVSPSNTPRMVDVSDKNVAKRTAVAQATLLMPPEIKQAFQDGDIKSAKGPVFHTAIIAGTQAVKKTADIIPFCHTLFIENCHFQIEVDDVRIIISCEVSTTSKTGVEMEALTGVSVAALTVYDMTKALSHEMIIETTRLIKKTGGKSDISLMS